MTRPAAGLASLVKAKASSRRTAFFAAASAVRLRSFFPGRWLRDLLEGGTSCASACPGDIRRCAVVG